ncbi:MAG: hypothetical protein IJO09_03535 [Oscillospiraceae bacterium]|nr:hypothetical protein [Oscillospiraceae bacterium]
MKVLKFFKRRKQKTKVDENQKTKVDENQFSYDVAPTYREIDSHKYTTKLDNIVELIISDCRRFGVPEKRIEQFLEKGNELNQEQGNHDWMFIAYNLNGAPGYSITNWERGQCNFGYGDCDELNFRFLFQKNTVQQLYNLTITEENKNKAEKFMNDSFELFGETSEYKKALDWFEKAFRRVE